MDVNLEDTDKDYLTNKGRIQCNLINIAPIFYVLLLIWLQLKDIDRMNIPSSIFENPLLNQILIAFIFVIVGDLFLTYKVLIPQTALVKEPKARFNMNFVILMAGGDAISVYGLIIGVLWWTQYWFIPFYLILPIIGFGIIHGYYLYSKYVITDYARKEYLRIRNSFSEKVLLDNEIIDTNMEIFKPISNYLNSNEKILLYYRPGFKKFLKTGIEGSIGAVILSFFLFWVFSTTFIFPTKFASIPYLLFGFGCFSFTLLPLIVIFKTKNLKRTLFVFTTQKIIANTPKKITRVPYSHIISSKISLEKLKSDTIEIMFKESQDDGTSSNETILIQMVPRELNLLKRIQIIKEKYSN